MTLQAIKKLFLPSVLATALAALIGGAPAEAAARTWSIVVHFTYQDGSEYDYVLRTGVATQDMPSMLAECGASHSTGSVVRYHCFPIPE